MESKIPLPTDNIYKFYALFGLLLLVTSIAAFTYVHQTTNALLMDSYIAVVELEQKKDLTPVETRKKEVLERRVEIAVQDRKTFGIALAVLLSIAFYAMYYGFRQWHTVIQPKQDRLFDLQLQKAELELAALQKEQHEVL